MEFGQPSTGAPRAAIETAHRVLDSDGMGYWESPALKARLARHYAETYGVTVDPDQFIITCGASPGLVLALTSRFSPATASPWPGRATSPIAIRYGRCTWSRWRSPAAPIRASS